MPTTTPTPALEKLKNRTLLNLGALSIWTLFKIVRRFDARFRRSLNGFDAVIRFRTDGSSVHLIFADGNVSLARRIQNPDFTIDFLDMPGVVEIMKKDSGNMMRLLFENKITKSGNNYYLMKLGYLASLSERFINERAGVVKARWDLIRG